MSGDRRHVVIVGNGISGVTAARHLRKLSNDRITIVSAESKYFYSRPALMYVYMGHMDLEHTQPYEDWFWKKNRIDLVQGYVKEIDHEAKKLILADAPSIEYDELILATGAKHNMYGWPGQDLEGVQGFTNLWDMEQLEKKAASAKKAVIVGGGLIGIEVAEMLRVQKIDVTMLVREPLYWNHILPVNESHVVGRHILEHGVDLRLETELKEIIDDGNGRVGGVVTSKGDTIDCSIVVISAGVSPRLELAKNSGIPTGRGILVDEHFATTIPHVHAVGDCAERPGGLVDLLWYTGRAHGEHVARELCGQSKPYEPEPFYNSAKFFDIEYQTYGLCTSDVKDEHCFLWEGADGRRLLRIVHKDQIVKGFNTLGIRLRGETCLKWIAEGATLDHVLENLLDANFDPEFYTSVRDIKRTAA